MAEAEDKKIEAQKRKAEAKAKAMQRLGEIKRAQARMRASKIEFLMNRPKPRLKEKAGETEE
jgi:hypothetical protein